MQSLYNRFKEIAKPFSKGQFLDNTTKDGIILEILTKYNPSYIENVGIYIPAEKETKKVLVSHIDLVYPFQKGFTEGKVFQIVEDKLYGALDNTLTNAFLINAIIELKEKGLASDVAFLFTEGEESGMTGMSTFMRTIHPKLNDPFYINLDVTNDNQDYIASIEFDCPSLEISKEIYNLIPNAGFTNYRFSDDVSAIVGHTPKAFSYCIPTWNYCHTYESYAKIESLEPYYNGLLKLITTLNVSNYKNDLSVLTRDMLI